MAKDSGGLGETKQAPEVVSESRDRVSASEAASHEGTTLTKYGQAYELVGREGVRRDQLNGTLRYRAEWAAHESENWPKPRQEADTEGSGLTDTPERSEVRPPDLEGSWRDGKSERYLDPERNSEVDLEYGRLRECADSYGEQVRQIAERSGGETAGYEYRLKGADRLKDKIAQQTEFHPEQSPIEALSRIPDAVRYTIKIPDACYAEGTDRAVAELRGNGFQLVEGGWRNSWGNDIYRGINSRWRDPANGQLFEVQFHTPGSLYAKEVTHQAYERARLPGLVREERQNIDQVQRQVTTRVPVPDGATDLYYEADWRRGA